MDALKHARGRSILALGAVALWLGSGVVAFGYGFVGAPPADPSKEPEGSRHVWVCRGRVELFEVPYSACGTIPPVGWFTGSTADVLAYTGELGSYLREDGPPQIPMRARLRMDFRGDLRGPGMTLPLWVPAAALIAWAALPLASRRRAGCCKDCGYSAQGLPKGARCPECGVGGPPPLGFQLDHRSGHLGLD